tara:strand:- start:1013 stop:1219 length:207 start_codon:yes stop_codon:yes gene_type:complete
MKLALNLCLFLSALFNFSDGAFSLTNNQIKKICNKEKKVSYCIKKLREKKFDLQEGKKIEIPVIPYKI